MWSWSSAFGPGPSVTPLGPTRNGLAGNAIRRKKKKPTANITAIAQPTSASSRRVRNRHATAAVNPARTSTQSRIEPSSALHRAAKLCRAGVSREPTFCTYCSEKSRVINARSIITNAPPAAASTTQA